MEGEDLVNPVTLERVAKLVLVVKKSCKREVPQLSNDELYSVNMDNLVDGNAHGTFQAPHHTEPK